ncbi:hypothetical protein HK100_001731 [Physocladia obscura]|uniref:BHLH domain-containing protein n=1 Tax=Physocladia obscura TaxID=109957 RepID=A0AAD5XBL0_9FUNG|nr:hypothetical protein HK100_001731 [Physocladia obscura]
MLPPRPPFDAATADYTYNYGINSGGNSDASIGGITGDAELFNFYELFGDPTSAEYENTNSNNSSEEEALLSSEDQSMFAQFLDTLGGSASSLANAGIAGIAGIASSQLSSLMLSFPQGLFGPPLSLSSISSAPFGMAPLFNQNQHQIQIQHNQQNQPQVVRKRSVEGLRPQSQSRLSSFSNAGVIGMLGGSYRDRDRDTVRDTGDTRDMRDTWEQHEIEREREFKHEAGHESMTIPMGETEFAAQAAVNESASASLLASSLPKRLKSSPSSRAFSLLAPSFYHQQNAQAPSLFTPTSFNATNLQGLINTDNKDYASSLDSFSFIPSLSTSNNISNNISSNNSIPQFSLNPQHTQQHHFKPHQELNQNQQHQQSQKLENCSHSILQNQLHPDLDLISNHPATAISTAQLLPPSPPIIHTSAMMTAVVPAPAQAPKKRGRKPKDPSINAAKTAFAGATVAAVLSSTTATTPSVTAKNSKSLLTPSEKKANHIQAEQRRRAQIREALKELTVLVPGLRPPIEGDCSVEGSSRVQILDGARMFVALLMERNEDLKAQLM